MIWIVLAIVAAVAGVLGYLYVWPRIVGERLPDELSPDPSLPWYHRKRTLINRLTGSNTTIGPATNWEWRRLALQYGVEVPHPPDPETVAHEWYHILNPVNPFRYAVDKKYAAKVEAPAHAFGAANKHDQRFVLIADWLAKEFAE